jgi:hypothetical protein
MQNWMKGSGYPDQEPFVMIDWVSGRLRPLYNIDLNYDTVSGLEVTKAAASSDDEAIFNPTMLDLVLSPQQREACQHALEYNTQV